MASINEMRAERARIFEQAKALNQRATDEDRDLSAEERAAWDEMNTDIDRLAKQINDTERDERIAAVRSSLDPDAERSVNRTPAKDFERRFGAFLAGETRTVTVTASDVMEQRAVVTGSAPGSHTVPISFVNQLREHLIEASAVRQANPTVLNTAGGEDLRIPKTTAHPTAVLIGEGSAITPQSEPTLATVTLEAYKYANLFQVSREFLQDEAVNVMEYLARINGQALGNISGEHFVSGTGSAQPRGVATGAAVAVTQVGATLGPTGDSLIDLQHSVVSGYRRNAYWLMNDSTVAGVRKLKSSDNQYLWQPGLQAGQPDLILGRPVITDPNVADGAHAAKSVLYGDFSGYYIRDVQSVTFERSDDYAFNTDLVTFRAIIRTDGDLVDENAVKAFTTSAT